MTAAAESSAGASQDLRRWLAEADAAGELRRYKGVSWDIEMGAVADLASRQPVVPALLFDAVPGYPCGFRVLVNSLADTARVCRTARLGAVETPLEAVRLWKERYRTAGRRPVHEKETGPVMANRMDRPDVDLLAFPAPRWRSGDGGRFIGTGTLCVTRSPETGTVNVGTARVMVHDERHVFFRVSAGKDSRRHFEQACRAGRSLPIAISLGHAPSLLLVGGLNIGYGINEFEVWGGLMQESLEVVTTPRYQLPVPSHSEIVLEGRVAPGQSALEGPFGEWSGYYSRSAREEPLIEVEAIYYRDDPILLGIATSRPPSELTTFWGLFRSALLWQQLEDAGIGGVRGVWCHPAGGTRLFNIVSVEQQHPGHARQALMAAASVPAGAYMGRYWVAVDADIDPTDTDSVLWALSTRSEPSRDLDLIRGAWGGPLDPSGQKGDGSLNSRVLIDACRPYGGSFPDTAGYSSDQRERARLLWREALAP